MPEALHEKAVARHFRKVPTPSEAVLWKALRSRGLDGWKFGRQQPIGPFILDFFCPEARLVEEVDGPIHESQREADATRDELLESLSIRGRTSRPGLVDVRSMASDSLGSRLISSSG